MLLIKGKLNLDLLKPLYVRIFLFVAQIIPNYYKLHKHIHLFIYIFNFIFHVYQDLGLILDFRFGDK